MIKFGTLKDFKAQKEKAEKSGLKPKVVIKDVMTRQLVIRENNKDVEILHILRWHGTNWIFRYNNAYWKE